MSTATVKRKTKETDVSVSLAKGEGRAVVETGLPFFDHMLSTLAKYAALDLELRARGDLRHHLIEDVAISLGAAVSKLVPATAARYGHRVVPMDDALVEATVDVGGRFYYRGGLKSRLYEHFLRSFAENAKTTLHVRILRGKDSHHLIECTMKAVGLALREALAESGAVFSTKGAVTWEVK
jgi:imidazoleglycerol-phosphate dehydratase